MKKSGVDAVVKAVDELKQWQGLGRVGRMNRRRAVLASLKRVRTWLDTHYPAIRATSTKPKRPRKLPKGWMFAPGLPGTHLAAIAMAKAPLRQYPHSNWARGDGGLREVNAVPLWVYGCLSLSTDPLTELRACMKSRNKQNQVKAAYLLTRSKET